MVMSILSLRMKKIPYLRPMKPKESFNASTTNIVRISESKSRVSLLFWIWMRGIEFAEQRIQISDLFVYLMYMYMDVIH